MRKGEENIASEIDSLGQTQSQRSKGNYCRETNWSSEESTKKPIDLGLGMCLVNPHGYGFYVG